MTESTNGTRHTAGAFDVRTFIATLMALFGVILLLTGMFAEDKGDGMIAGNAINVWVGIALLVFAAAMQGWALLRPTIVDDDQLAVDKDSQPPSH